MTASSAQHDGTSAKCLQDMWKYFSHFSAFMKRVERGVGTAMIRSFLLSVCCYTNMRELYLVVLLSQLCGGGSVKLHQQRQEGLLGSQEA